MPWTESRVPVIADERVEREFGTGALKITPGHDPTDFEIGRDHGLPEPSVHRARRPRHRRGARRADAGRGRREDPRLVQGARPAREARALPPHGRVLRALPLAHRAAHLAAVVVLDGRDQAAAARSAPRAARSRYHPESQHRFAIDSLENAPDWCISRQIWWGHQIPVWYCPDGHMTVEETSRPRAPSAARRELTRETDVLDTWFCSALWPFATLGWPERDAGPRALLSGRRANDRARDHPPLGEPDDLLRARAARRASRSTTSSSTRRCSRPTAGACRSRSAPASTRSS